MKKSIKSNKEAAPVVPTVETVKPEVKYVEPKIITYVVVRDGYRVSDREYLIVDDPIAITEKEFWTKVATDHSWGEKVDIVQYDPKKHRTW